MIKINFLLKNLDKARQIMKVAVLSIIFGGFAIACSSSDDDEEPTGPDYEELTRQFNALAVEVRAAVEPAKKVDIDITAYFDSIYNEEYSGRAELYEKYGMRLIDSAYTFMNVIIHARRDLGTPLPTNNTTMTHLYDKCASLAVVHSKLAGVCDLPH